MKPFTAFIFLVTFSVQTFYTAGVTAWFYANQKLLAKKHCVNKYRPELHCDGKCFLSKKIKEAEQKEEQQAPFQVKWVETAPGIVSSCNLITCFIKKLSIKKAVYSDSYSYNFTSRIFHPPAFSVA